jgi:trans-2-enoyl-CoA reductase
LIANAISKAGLNLPSKNLANGPKTTKTQEKVAIPEIEIYIGILFQVIRPPGFNLTGDE